MSPSFIKHLLSTYSFSLLLSSYCVHSNAHRSTNMNRKWLQPSEHLSLSRKDEIYINRYCANPGPGLKFSAQSKSHLNEWVKECNVICYRSLLMRITLGLGHRASRSYWRLGRRMSLRNSPEKAGLCNGQETILAAPSPSLGLSFPILSWRDDTDELWSMSSNNVPCFYDPSSQHCMGI